MSKKLDTSREICCKPDQAIFVAKMLMSLYNYLLTDGTASVKVTCKDSDGDRWVVVDSADENWRWELHGAARAFARAWWSIPGYNRKSTTEMMLERRLNKILDVKIIWTRKVPDVSIKTPKAGSG